MVFFLSCLLFAHDVGKQLLKKTKGGYPSAQNIHFFPESKRRERKSR